MPLEEVKKLSHQEILAWLYYFQKRAKEISKLYEGSLSVPGKRHTFRFC